MWVVFFQAEDGIRDLVRSRGLGDVYKRQVMQVRRPVEELHHEVAALGVVHRQVLGERPVHHLSLIHI